MRTIGILGGTFNPVHHGHISIAQQALSRLALDEVRFIPLNNPPHRNQPLATAGQRQDMLELTISDLPDLVLDTRELASDNISYTIDTLQSLRNDHPGTSLILLMGDDAFAKIDGWKDWHHLLDYAHIVTIKREGDSEELIPYTVSNWMNKYIINDSEQLHDESHGHIYRLEIEPIATSSTQVRHRLDQRLSLEDLLPEKVIDYINTHHLYQS